MSRFAARMMRPLVLCTSVLALAACEDGLDWDLRPSANGGSTAEAARQATEQRPRPDERGVISYPNYQVVVARGSESVAQIAQRLDLNPEELARFNSLSADTQLRSGEVLALPSRVAAGPPGTGTGGIDVATIATTALDRADQGTEGRRAPVQVAASDQEPVRHRVERGETAYSIARLYNVSTRSLADWNGLGSDLEVREGQYLLIPVPAQGQSSAAAAPSEAPRPGSGSATPEPPSAARPLPQDDPATATPPAPPPSPDLTAERSPEPEPEPTAEEPAQTAASSDSRLSYPVEGRIIRDYSPGTNDGISIAASAGTAVRAAASGTVAAITRDTDQMPILVIRHADNLLTVYANIDDIQVERGATVQRSDRIAAVRAGDPAFIHFEVRQGFDSVDPMDFLP